MRLCSFVTVFALLLPASAIAQTDSAYYKTESQMLVKNLAQAGINKKNCFKIAAGRIAACQTFATKMIEVRTKLIEALDAWQKAVDDGDQAKIWEGKIAYNQINARHRELVRTSWTTEKYFDSKWTSPKTPITSEFYDSLLKRATEISGAVCTVLPGERSAECARDMKEYIDSIGEMIEVRKRKESARAAADMGKYFDTHVEEGHLLVKMTVAQAKVNQKYYP
jgi:hypothetical protein